MAVNSAHYVVTREIAERTGELQNHYRTDDGRFVLDDRALSLIRFMPDEYVSGLRGVERITRQEALTLIAKGGYKMGDEGNDFGTTDNAEAPKDAEGETDGISEDYGDETLEENAEDNAEDAETPKVETQEEEEE